MSDIQSGVMKCISTSLSVKQSQLKLDTLLIGELNADSLDIMDIMFQLEEEFDIKLEKEDFDFLRKIGMERDIAVVDGLLTKEAKEKLQSYLPALKVDSDIKPADLGTFLSVSSIIGLVQSRLGSV